MPGYSMSDGGVLYLTWGNKSRVAEGLERSIASLAKYHAELPIHVEGSDNDASFLNKTAMYDLSPFEETVFLDGKMDIKFEH